MTEGHFDDILSNPLFAKALQNRTDIRRAIEKQDKNALMALADRHFLAMFDDMKACLIPHAAQDFQVSGTALDTMIRGVSVNSTPDFNAEIRMRREGEDLVADITVYWGLMRFFYFMTDIVFAYSAVGVMNEDKKITDVPTPPKIAFKQVCRCAKELIADFWTSDFGGASYSLLTALTDKQQFVAAKMLDYAECFVLAHEIGHIGVSIAPDCLLVRIGKAFADGLIDRLAGASTAEKKDLKENWGEEFAADVFGMKCSVMLGKDYYDKMLRYSAAHLALMMFHMLEMGHLYIKKAPIRTDTHPPSVNRSLLLRALAENDSNPKHPKEFFTMADQLWTLGDDLLKEIYRQQSTFA